MKIKDIIFDNCKLNSDGENFAWSGVYHFDNSLIFARATEIGEDIKITLSMFEDKLFDRDELDTAELMGRLEVELISAFSKNKWETRVKEEPFAEITAKDQGRAVKLDDIKVNSFFDREGCEDLLFDIFCSTCLAMKKVSIRADLAREKFPKGSVVEGYINKDKVLGTYNGFSYNDYLEFIERQRFCENAITKAYSLPIGGMMDFRVDPNVVSLSGWNMSMKDFFRDLGEQTM